MRERESALQRLSVGDIFHARASNGASLVCLVTSVSGGRIFARRIHTQEEVEFDQQSGFEAGSVHTRIDSVAPPPAEISKVLLDQDRKYGDIAREFSRGVQLVDIDPERLKLTADELRASKLLRLHHEANPI